MTLSKTLPRILAQLPVMFQMELSPRLTPLDEKDPLVELGLADENGLTSKGRKVLDDMKKLADHLDAQLL